MACCIDSGSYTFAETERALGWTVAYGLRSVAMIATGVSELHNLYKGYSRQHKIQERAVEISELEQEHLELYFWPRELEFLNAYASPTTYPELNPLAAMYTHRLRTQIAKSFADLFRRTECGSGRYCQSDTDIRLQDLSLARAQAYSNAIVLGRMMAFAEIQQKKDRDHRRRVQAIALGRSLMQEAASMMSMAQQGLAAVTANYAQSLSRTVEALGYSRRRQVDQGSMVRQNGASAPYKPLNKENGADFTPPPMLARDPITGNEIINNLSEYELNTPYDWSKWQTYNDIESRQNNSTHRIDKLDGDFPASRGTGDDHHISGNITS